VQIQGKNRCRVIHECAGLGRDELHEASAEREEEQEKGARTVKEKVLEQREEGQEKRAEAEQGKECTGT
jgi:hypothetical protein